MIKNSLTITLFSLLSLGACQSTNSSLSNSSTTVSATTTSLSSTSSSSFSSSSSSATSSSSSATSSTVTLPDIEKPTGYEDWIQKKYTYTFTSEDILDKNGCPETTPVENRPTFNNVNYTFSSLPYSSYGAGKGLQFGSGKSPVTDADFILSGHFGEDVYVKNITVVLSVASSGRGAFTLNVGNTTKDTIKFTNTSPDSYVFENIDTVSESFNFTFRSEVKKAMYLYSIDINLFVNPDSELDFSFEVPERDPVMPGKNDILPTKYTLVDKEEYYKDIDMDLTGNNLRLELNELIKTITEYSYDQARYTIPYTDENPSKPGYIYGLYDGDDIVAKWDGGTSWNREHVWACAHMNIDGSGRPDGTTKNHTTDLHNLRGCSKDTNEFHSDKYYDYVSSGDYMFPNVTSNEVNGIHNFVGDHRGDVARTLFYMYTMYMGTSGSKALILTDDIANSDSACTMGKLSVLLEWNKEDPVDEFEIQRNNRVFEYQGNRNPFIDYPELADQLFQV